MESLAASGIREIVLTGIETGSYGRDFAEQYDLGDLIRELDARGSCERIRLGSLAPELVGERFAEKISGVGILAPHFHVSMQSGSDKILKAMKRRYTRARAIENIERLRSHFPTAHITTDLMVGFPGEEEEDFLLTSDFVREVGLLDAHVFAYSPRRGTPAATYAHQIPEQVKRERSERLIAIKNEVRDRVLDGIVERGEPLPAIAESRLASGMFGAHSDSYVEIGFYPPEGVDMTGEAVRVVPVSHSNGVVFGKLI